MNTKQLILAALRGEDMTQIQLEHAVGKSTETVRHNLQQLVAGGLAHVCHLNRQRLGRAQRVFRAGPAPDGFIVTSTLSENSRRKHPETLAAARPIKATFPTPPQHPLIAHLFGMVP